MREHEGKIEVKVCRCEGIKEGKVCIYEEREGGGYKKGKGMYV